MAGDSASPAPLLGTAFLLSQSASSPSATASSSSAAPSSATHTAITPSVCTDYSLFKRLVDQSRRVSDDAITVRLNRAAALGGGAVAGRGAREMGAGECDAVWRELVGRWSERGEALSYCDRVLLEQAAQAKGKTTAQAQGGAGVLGEEEGLSADWERRGRGFADELELKRSRLSTELSVESIIRARSLALFRSRCPAHPLADPPAPDVPRLLDAAAEEEERRRRRGRDERGRVRWT